MNDDLNACAGIVEKGDPPRFRAVMSAPPTAREALFPLYAFNVEVARAPWVTSEPGIAEIRLQWWIDALGEIAGGGMVRRHEVVVPLALAIAPEQAQALVPMVEARSRDIYSDPFADEDALLRYLDVTSGGLLEVAAGVLGDGAGEAAKAAGRAQGVANWLLAVPALKAAGRQPLPDETEAGVARLAEAGLAALREARSAARPNSVRPVFNVMAGVGRVLTLAKRQPERVLAATLEPAPLSAALALMRASVLGRW
ncbi:squalene/phytoene synthase family protein [Rhodobacteraceae bacterium D3-12]|nr:squalene/phytoene synthase family protein [Rhodobacteraceae bacterium D3-12]